MDKLHYKGKGEHSVNELELIIEQQAEELHLLNSGQKQLNMHDVSRQSEQLKTLLIKLLENNMCSHKGDDLIIEALKGF